ncbi:GNAT family N-acetyltransferase [Chelativorans sp. AA-79]|uniref:GNAT family N-acetyltransferase n=1 Tax=Chelativorans sp. AA-79 TaxID=3028735 RepID=UPI0023F8AA94|nr:GNAT family N-acetyltransferase [Chelativorans sp. AA-79]WEX07406.1 GNAT family N-acetyltransferase [Chelativorans sp. AA-79]
MTAKATSSRGRVLTAVVTHLQMGVQPQHYPPAPAGMQLALLKCRDMPLHFYRYLYDRVGREWHWTAALTLSDRDLKERVDSDRADIRVLYLDGAPAGFFELRLLSEQECRLVHFGLMPHAIGRGLGRWFLGTAIRAGWEHAPRIVSVETCTLDHPAALQLYQKLGFSPVWRREETVSELSPEARAAVLLRS